jgi:outer membrane protein OmpA-like peptidoglycan-associated protein
MTSTRLLLAGTALSLVTLATAAPAAEGTAEPFVLAQAAPAEAPAGTDRREQRREERAGDQGRERPEGDPARGRERAEERRPDAQEPRRERAEERPDRREQRREERAEERQQRREERREDRREERVGDQGRERRPDAADVRPERREERAEDRRDVVRERRVEEVTRGRRERVEDGGRRTVIEEPGNRLIVREGNRVVIRHDESDRFRRAYRGADVRVERRGAEEYTVVRQPGGVEIVTVRDADGDLVRRVRRARGVETVLIDNVVRAGNPRRRGVVQTVVELPPPRISIPREKYVVDVERASQADLVETFEAPPVERVERSYTLDEVRQSRSVRERVRSVDIDTITFEFGSWELPEDQVGALTGVATAIRRALERNPDEIFLIEGHTDAVGPDVDNLSLSDRRAEAIADALTDRFGIPAENLTTQGYGEQYLKVSSEGEERRNRRVTVRRITPLLKGAEG